MQRMSAQDASFLHVESDDRPMHVGGVSIFEGPPPPFAEVMAMIEGKLALVPRYRQIVRFVPFALARPVWVDDPHFNLGYHVRRTALPAPGGDRELRTLVGRVMSQNLDRAKPLWEMWVAEGLAEGRWALISKVHHAMVDGVAGTDLMTVLLDTERNPEPLPPDSWMAEPAPGSARLLADAIRERGLNPFIAAEQLVGAFRAPRQLASVLADTSRGLAGFAGVARRGESSSLNGPLGPHRRWDWARGQQAAPARAQHGHHQRPGPAVPTVPRRTAVARVLSLHPFVRERPGGGRDLLLRRRAQLRRQRRLRHRSGHRGPLPRDRARPERAGGAGPATGRRTGARCSA